MTPRQPGAVQLTRGLALAAPCSPYQVLEVVSEVREDLNHELEKQLEEQQMYFDTVAETITEMEERLLTVEQLLDSDLGMDDTHHAEQDREPVPQTEELPEDSGQHSAGGEAASSSPQGEEATEDSVEHSPPGNDAPHVPEGEEDREGSVELS